MNNRASHIRKRALELAQSGNHIDCLTIELALANEGFPDAYEVIKDADFRAFLKAVCDKHWHPAKAVPQNGAQELTMAARHDRPAV